MSAPTLMIYFSSDGIDRQLHKASSVRRDGREIINELDLRRRSTAAMYGLSMQLANRRCRFRETIFHFSAMQEARRKLGTDFLMPSIKTSLTNQLVGGQLAGPLLWSLSKRSLIRRETCSGRIGISKRK